MKKYIISALCMMYIAVLYGQAQSETPPRWMDNDVREKLYPSDAYYTGFENGNIEINETIEHATERIKLKAQSSLAKSFSANIESKATIDIKVIREGKVYDESISFSESSKTVAKAEVFEMKTECYHNKESKSIYAFAYVSRKDLKLKYTQFIYLKLKDVESKLTIPAAKSSEQKFKNVTNIKKENENIKKLLEDVQAYRYLLIIVSNKIVDENELQIIKFNELQIKFNSLINEKISFYIDTKEEIDSVDTTIISGTTIISSKIKSALAGDYAFANCETDADFILTAQVKYQIETSFREYYGYIKQFRGNIKMKIIDNGTEKNTVYENDFQYLISTSLSDEDGAQRFFKEVVVEIIKYLTNYLEKITK